MKATKLFFAISLLTISLSSNAQKLEKGTWLTGGTLSYVNQTVKYTNTSPFSAPSSTSNTQGAFIASFNVANMVSKNVALGANVTYLTAFGLSSSSVAVLGPAARVYFTNEKPSKVFLLGNVGFNTKGGSASYNAGLGLANFLSDYVSIDITGTYGNTFNSPFSTNNLSSNSADYSVSIFALQVGLQIYLPRKKI